MTAPPPLTERRRRETLSALHEAALAMIRARGLEAATVEEIARAAGVSRRTFFNYYPHKEAALTGPPLAFPEEAAEGLATGTGPLAPALETFLEAHLAQFAPRRAQLAELLTLAGDSPRLLGLRQIALYGRRDLLTALLVRRLPGAPRLRLQILSHAVLAAAGAAIEAWARGEADDLAAAARANLAEIGPAAALLEAAP